MGTVNFKSEPVTIKGWLPPAGSNAPDFVLTRTNLSDVTLKEFTGGILVLNIFPSIDTPVCAA
ncbi:MAG: redoxin family protein, partial [Victivallaceae bacterium]|nr:redoxin family protein [Victivallaceae bacterium]